MMPFSFKFQIHGTKSELFLYNNHFDTIKYFLTGFFLTIHDYYY